MFTGGIMKVLMSTLLVLVVIIATIWLTRAWRARGMPDLESWHQVTLKSEYRAKNFRDGISFSQYQKLEQQLMQELEEKVESHLSDAQKVPNNRYYAGGPAHRSAWPTNWNLSYERIPDNPRGAIVLLHGASDSPYSMRKLADVFYAMDLYVIVPRLPGHGTIPNSLLKIRLEDWNSIVPIALAETHKHITADAPVFLGGYSTGATLAMSYALDALEHRILKQIDGVMLFSPALSVSGFARFAAWDELVSVFPGFEKFAWVDIRPEYDPFKYASFPKRAGSIVYELTARNLDRMADLRGTELWQELPPIISFQSIVDATVNEQEVLELHQQLPASGHELVLFDLNRYQAVQPFLRNDSDAMLQRVQDEDFRHVDVTLIGTHDARSKEVVAQRTRANHVKQHDVEVLQAQWPKGVVSLSHVAIPFPPDDPVYGSSPPPGLDHYNLTNAQSRGERGVTVIPAEDLNRIRYNPFFDYVKSRAEAFITKAFEKAELKGDTED